MPIGDAAACLIVQRGKFIQQSGGMEAYCAIGAAAGPASYHGFTQGNEETGMFFFGSDAEDMFARVEPLLRKLPIGQNARVVIRHGKKSLNPRDVRMPRQ